MSKRKVCKKCKMFVEGSECPICKTSQFSTSWKGRVYYTDTNKSMIADKMHVTTNGEYAIKIS